MSIKVKDKDVEIVYVCPECGEMTSVNPSWHQHNGTPVCGKCDVDMDFIHVEINKSVLNK